MKSDTQLVHLASEAPVHLRVIVGEGQPGGSTMLWNGEISDVLEPEGRVVADRGADAMFKVLHCSTFVKDVSTDHNRTSVTYVITSANEVRFLYAQEVPKQGDWAQYAISFVFVPMPS